MPHPAAHLPTLACGRWFAALPHELAGALMQMAQLRTLSAGEALFLRGAPPCGLYALVRGAIDISGAGGPSDRGRAALLTRLEPPSWFGEIAVFDRAPRTPRRPAPWCMCRKSRCWPGWPPTPRTGTRWRCC